MSNGDTTESPSRTSTGKIKTTGTYVFGPVKRGKENEAAEGGSSVEFMQTADQGVNYPREYTGKFLINTFSITTFKEYLEKNPENLRPGRRFFFFENEEGLLKPVFSGTMMPNRAMQQQHQPTALADGGVNGIAAAHTNGQQPSERQSRIEYQDVVETMRQQIESLSAQVQNLSIRNDQLNNSIIDAEQKKAAAEARLDMVEQRHSQDRQHLVEAHKREIEQLKEMHEKDVQLLAQKAVDEALEKYAQETALNDDGKTSGLDKMMGFISDNSEIVTPLISVATEFAKEFVAGMRQRRNPEQIQAHAPVANAPQPLQPTATFPIPMAPQPQPQPMQQPVQVFNPNTLTGDM